MLLEVLQRKKLNTLSKKNLQIGTHKKKEHLSLMCSYIIKNTKQLLARVCPGLLLASYLITKNVKFNKMGMRPTPLFLCPKKMIYSK